MIWVRSYSMCANERQTNTAFESSAACFQGHLSKDDTHPPPLWPCPSPSDSAGARTSEVNIWGISFKVGGPLRSG